MSHQNGYPGRAAFVPVVRPADIVRLKPVWESWDVLDVRVARLPQHITTYDLWFAFQREGQVDSIDIFVNRQGKRDGNAKVRFK